MWGFGVVRGERRGRVGRVGRGLGRRLLMDWRIGWRWRWRWRLRAGEKEIRRRVLRAVGIRVGQSVLLSGQKICLDEGQIL